MRCYVILRGLLFLLPPERAHGLVMHVFAVLCCVPACRRWLRRRYCWHHPALRVRVDGLSFPNPVGLAAGFDKNGRWIKPLAHLGFGFVEVGTITPKPQLGNPKPRLFRLSSQRSLVNRMGFNNRGADALYERLRRVRGAIVVGVNIGRNKNTPNKRAVEDYLYCFRRLFEVSDYFVINLSSPNTEGIRLLQRKPFLGEILTALTQENSGRTHPKPLFLKISPDNSQRDLSYLLQEARKHCVGLVISNTQGGRHGGISGGVSGNMLYARATKLLAKVHQETHGALPLIGVGGIDSASRALQKLQAGASLLQLYTGLVYEGPMLVKRILHALARGHEGKK